jgi:hypothetical protein
MQYNIGEGEKMTKKIVNYEEIKKEAEKPASMRDKIVVSNRGNTVKPRRYHLVKERADFLKEQYKKTSVFPNPYRNNGMYHAIVQSLINLGINKKHSFSEIKKEIENILTLKKKPENRNLWQTFKCRKPRNPLSGKDINGRIIDNMMILQRVSGLHPFGEKLRQLNACINIFKDNNGLPIIELKTDFESENAVVIINEIRKSKKEIAQNRSPGKEKDKV